MRKGFVLLAAIIFSASIDARSQNAQSPTLVYPDFSIRLPVNWVTLRPSGMNICSMEGVERSDGAKPQLSVQAIEDRNQSNEDLTRLILSKYANTNILAKEEYADSWAQQKAHRIELKFRLKNQLDKRLEQVVLYASWWAIRVQTQKKIYLIILLDKADDLADGLKSAKSALGSFKPTH